MTNIQYSAEYSNYKGCNLIDYTTHKTITPFVVQYFSYGLATGILLATAYGDVCTTSVYNTRSLSAH